MRSLSPRDINQSLLFSRHKGYKNGMGPIRCSGVTLIGRPDGATDRELADALDMRLTEARFLGWHLRVRYEYPIIETRSGEGRDLTYHYRLLAPPIRVDTYVQP